jgi:hypothetical protein
LHLSISIGIPRFVEEMKGHTATHAAEVRMIDTPTRLRKEGSVWKINSSRIMAKKTDVYIAKPARPAFSR